MNIKDFRSKILAIIQKLNDTRSEQAALIGREALALVRRRIQNEGKNADGARLDSYSTNPVPAFFFFGDSVTAAGEAKIRASAKKGHGVSYKEFREYNNRRTDITDLTFTGSMWKEMDVFPLDSTAVKATVKIEPRTQRSKRVAAFNSDRYGNILALSKLERDQLKEANFRRVAKIIESEFVK